MPWTKISAVEGIKPSEWIKRKISNMQPAHRMPRKSWTDILGSDYLAFRKVIEAWQNAEYHPHAWNTYSERKLKTEDREWLAKVQAELRHNGWFAPQVIEGTLGFASLYRADHIHDERQGFVQRSQPAEPDFIQEEVPV